MKINNNDIEIYKKVIENNSFQSTYRFLIEYMLNLKTYFKNQYPNYNVGNLYQGYIDMTYFSFTPEQIKKNKLKIAIVFQHKFVRFEVWLAGYNKQIQKEYWNLFKDNNFNKYLIVKSVVGSDAIIENIMVEKPDFDNLSNLKNQIEIETLNFIKDIEIFLTQFQKKL